MVGEWNRLGISLEADFQTAFSADFDHPRGSEAAWPAIRRSRRAEAGEERRQPNRNPH